MIMKAMTPIVSSALIVSLTSVIIVSCIISVSHQKNVTFAPLLIFGDSLLDAGNNHHMKTSTKPMTANFWPYGISHFDFPTGRFSNGRLVPDFLAERANMPMIPPYLQPGKRRRFYHGVNFASAGSGALIDPQQISGISLHSQLNNYKNVKKWISREFEDVETRRWSARAVHLFSVGVNDYMNLLSTNSTRFTTFTKSQYVNMVMGNISAVLDEIYKKGGRKFVFFNLPPVSYFPAIRRLDRRSTIKDRLDEVSSYMILHNSVLIHVLKDFEKKLPGFKFSVYDLYTSTLQRINHPSRYGYKYGKTSCCGRGKLRGVQSCGTESYELCSNVEDHLFWDSYHFTEKVYGQIADEMWYGVNYIHDSFGSNSYDIKDLFYLT